MTSPLLFNPRMAGRETLEETFVARHALLDQLLGDLRSDVGAPSRRQWLVVGPRGSGKSHLLELVSRRLQDDGWRVVRLPEEHYRVRDLATLLEQIARALDVLPDLDHDAPLDTVIDRCADAIREVDQACGGRLVVILENLGVLLKRKVRSARDQKRLRALFQHHPLCTLVTSATRHHAEVTDEKQPFYAFFQTRTLRDLEQQEVIDLVRRRAEHDGATALLERFDLVRPRIAALYHLSGGNPRLVLLLYAVLREGVSPRVWESLVQLLDEVTPYYQARLDDLSDQMRDVVVEMALHHDPILPSDLARRMRLGTNQVTAVLAKLEDERLVAKGGRKDGRSRYWEVRERLFRIWIEMRERGGEGQDKIRFIQDFYRLWYAGAGDEARQDAVRLAEQFWVALGEARPEAHLAAEPTLSYIVSAANLSEHDVLVEALDTAPLTLTHLCSALDGPPAVSQRAEDLLRERLTAGPPSDGDELEERGLAWLALREFDAAVDDMLAFGAVDLHELRHVGPGVAAAIVSGRTEDALAVLPSPIEPAENAVWTSLVVGCLETERSNVVQRRRIGVPTDKRGELDRLPDLSPLEAMQVSAGTALAMSEGVGQGWLSTASLAHHWPVWVLGGPLLQRARPDEFAVVMRAIAEHPEATSGFLHVLREASSVDPLTRERLLAGIAAEEREAIQLLLDAMGA